MTQGIRHSLWIILAAGCVFFLNLGVPQLWDEDEPKNAACAREMLERNDWVVPVFNYELRTAKPVLVYWFMMSAYELFGISEFGARFWSAVLGIGTCLLTYDIGRRLFDASAGFWAAFMLAAALMFGVASRAATPDAPLIFFSTLALAIFVAGLPKLAFKSVAENAGPHDSENRATLQLRQFLPQRWTTYLWMYTAMGFAVLAKGPVGVVLPTLILMGYVWQCRRGISAQAAEDHPVPRTRIARLLAELSPTVIWRVGWMLRPLTAIAVIALVAVPWYVWVGWRTDGAWIAGFLGKHNVTRFVQPLEGHSGPIFYYLIAVMIGFFPWSIFLPLACLRIVQRLRNLQTWTAGDALCAGWAVIYIGFFSLARTKLPSYVLPAYPALALITARYITEWLREPSGTSRWLTRLGFLILPAAGLFVLIGVPIAISRFLPGQWYLGWAGMIPLIGGAWAFRLTERQCFERAARVFAGVALLFTATLFGIVSVQVNPHQTSLALMSEIYAETETAEIGAFDYFEPSLVYYARGPVQRIKTAQQSAQFLTQNPDAFLIIRDKHKSVIEAALGHDVQVVAQRRRFLKHGDLLVLQCPAVKVPHTAAENAANLHVPGPLNRTAAERQPQRN
ncbi:MAG: glycosyl transferase family 39 [Planctomycetaceae bacterium]|nr:glycosyl transferase family 39 [Planctomycetaceae bacterium]